MSKTWVESLMESHEDQRLMAQEEAIFQVTELVCRLMEEQGITKKELAKRMGTSAANITQVLDGRRNMTIRTISDLLFNLNHVLEVREKTIFEKKPDRLPWVIHNVPFGGTPSQPQWRVDKNMQDEIRGGEPTENLECAG